MKRGFSLLELLVASLLLSMLVTILTMLFNKSSIAWTIGTASITGLSEARRDISAYGLEAENLILGDGDRVLRVTSVWGEDGSGDVLRRSGGIAAGRTLSTKFEKLPTSVQQLSDQLDATMYNAGGGTAAGRTAWLVGVTSYGPDGQTGGDETWDDITTMPEETVK